MAKNLAALAGYSNRNNNNQFDQTDASISNSRVPPAGVGLDDLSSLDASRIAPTQQRQSTGAPTKTSAPLQRRKTLGPPKEREENGNGEAGSGVGAAAPDTPQQKQQLQAQPDTERKPDNRRGFGVRISDNSIARPNGGLGVGGARRVPSGTQQDDSSLDQTQNTEDLELKAIQRDFSVGQETREDGLDTFSEDQIRPISPTSSTSSIGLHDPYSKAFASSSKGRSSSTAKGQAQTVKTAMQKINNLTVEKEDLQIELDYHRRKMSPEDQGKEIIALRLRNNTLNRKMTSLSELVTGQDKMIRVLNKEIKRGKREGEEGDGRKDQEFEELRERAERDDEELERLREEVRELRERESERSREQIQGADEALKSQLEALSSDHAVELHTLQIEKDSVLEDLEKINLEAQDLRNELMIVEEEKESLEKEAGEAKLALRTLETSHERLNNSLLSAKTNEQVLKDEKIDLEDIVDDLRHKLQKSGEESFEVQEDRREETNNLRDKITSLELEIERLKSQVDDYQAEHLEQLRHVEEIEDRVEGLESELRELEAGKEELEQFAADKEQEAMELDGQLHELEESNKVLVEDCNTIEKEREECLNLIDELKDLINLRDEDLEATNRELVESSNLRLELERQLDDKETGFKKLQAELGFVEERYEIENSHLTKSAHDAQLRLTDLLQNHEIKCSDLSRAEKELAEALKAIDELEDERENMLRDLKTEEEARDNAEEAFQAELDKKTRAWERDLEDKEEELKSIVKDLEIRTQELQNSRQDLSLVQEALRKIENDTMRLGQSQANDKHSLELEIDRLKRDLGRVEDELERARKEIERKEEGIREKERGFEKLHNEHREMSSKLASENQSRLGLDERFEVQQRAVKSAHEEIEALKSKIEELENELSRGEKDTLQSEQLTRTQLTERNTLLLSIYQYTGKIVGADRNTPRKRADDLKPFTNFPIFHDSLMGRLRRITEIQKSFEERAKTVEEKFAGQFAALKRQHDQRFRQIDSFEKSLKTATDKQGQWRSRLMTKQGELESSKSTVQELQAQISSLRTRANLASPEDKMKLVSLTNRANTAERKLLAAEKQLSNMGERNEDARNRQGEVDGRHMARIKELEMRNKILEEKWKGERQGAKERVKDLNEDKARLEKEVADANRRNQKLQAVHDADTAA